jgi:o-succinylbenzoate---CoA ligase
MYFNSRLTISSRADSKTIYAALGDGATMTSLVPTILQSVDISRFRTVLIGGAHAPKNLPNNAIATYGLTETMGGAIHDGVPLDGVEIRLGEDSEIEVRSRSLLRCYRNGVDPKTKDGWLPTGDLGEMKNGRLKVLGRRDEQINTGGYKVWPSTVENSIRELEVVTDVFVAGTPDNKWGSAVTAWVVLQPNVATLQLKTLREHVRETLPDYCAPQTLFVVDQIPKTSLGKVQMTELLKLSHESHE